MANLPETSEFTEGVRAFEPSDPARYDVLNSTLQPLVNRTKWLKDNMSQGGGGGSVPVEWIEGAGDVVLLTDLHPDTMYILDVRSGGTIGILIPENHSDIPVGAEYHFVCAGDSQDAYILDRIPEPEVN